MNVGSFAFRSIWNLLLLVRDGGTTNEYSVRLCIQLLSYSMRCLNSWNQEHFWFDLSTFVIQLFNYIDSLELQDTKISANGGLAAMASSTSTDRSETVSLLNREVVMNMNSIKDQPRKSCSLIFSKKAMTSRPFLYMIVAAAACFGICAVLLHPHEVGKLAVSIRRCLFDNSQKFWQNVCAFRLLFYAYPMSLIGNVIKGS